MAGLKMHDWKRELMKACQGAPSGVRSHIVFVHGLKLSARNQWSELWQVFKFGGADFVGLRVRLPRAYNTADLYAQFGMAKVLGFKIY